MVKNCKVFSTLVFVKISIFLLSYSSFTLACPLIEQEKYTLKHQKSEEIQYHKAKLKHGLPQLGKDFDQKIGGGFWYTSDFVFINIWSFHCQNFLPTFPFPLLFYNILSTN